MKHTLYIIALATFFIFTACNETIVTPAPQLEPIKKVGLKVYDVSMMLPLSNGSAVVPVINNSDESYFCIAIVNPDGSYIMSEPYPIGFYIERLFVNSAGEILVVSFTHNDDYDASYKLYKFNNQCILLSQNMIDNVPSTLFSNGDIAIFQHEFIETIGAESLVMKILENNLTYFLEQDFYTDYAFSFDDKIVLADIISGDFCIYKTDGTFLASGSVGNIIVDITYIDGFLYITTRGQITDSEELSDYNVQWLVYKVDINGSIVFSTPITAFQMYGNYSVVDGMLITTGTFFSDQERNKGYGSIFIINNENGKLIDSISVDYTGCDVLPLHVASDKKNGYNVYVLRQDSYDSGYNGFLDLSRGKLFIYHTDDLHKLDISTENQ